jgi:hypothetical protein
MDPLTRKQAGQFRNLSEEERRDYLRIRLYDEAEVWLDYFMTAGIESERLRSNFLLRPPQR